MAAWSRAVLAVTLVASLFAAVPLSAGQTPPGVAGTTTPQSAAAADLPADSNTTYRIDLQENGDARWTVTWTFQLRNESHRAGFDSLADEFTSGAATGSTLSAYEEASYLASTTTDRTMGITNVTRDASTDSNTGSLVLSFTWTDFGYRQDGQLYVDDVFRTETRWFPSLDESETLILAPPAGYQFFSASTNVQNGVLRWDGPHSFGASAPYAVFDATQPPPGTTTTSGGQTDDGSGIVPVFVVALIGALVVIAYVVRFRGLSPDEPDDEGVAAASGPGTTDGGNATDTADPDDIGARDRDDTGGTDSDETDDDVATDSDGIGAGAVRGSADDTPDEELLSDEERVERLLEANDGRMKQANIVEETGWSNAKVSQLLSGMADDDRIEKLRIGRENLISLPDNADE